MQNKKILLISHDMTVTGAPNSLLRQAQYFKNYGCDVEIWTLGGGGLLDRYKEKGFNPVFVKNSRRDIKAQYEKNNKKYDFILCNTTVTYKAVDVLQRYNTPLVWFIRETKLVDEGMKDDPDFAEVYRNFYNIYTVSEYAANISQKYNQNIKIINNAIEDDFKDFTPLHEPITFGFIGSIMPVKGIDLLLKAFNKLHKQYKNTKLIIAGHYNNKYGQSLYSQSADYVEWLGEIQNDQKKVFFDCIDCLCVPSLDEPSGLVVLEGAMQGKALIVTENTGANYMVDNEKNGFIIDTNDVESLYDAMVKLCKSDIKTMQKVSREKYLELGTTKREEKEVIKMLHDNINNYPQVNSELQLEPRKLPKWLGKILSFPIPIKKYRQEFRKKYFEGFK